MAVKKATTTKDVAAEDKPSNDAKTATVTAAGGAKVTVSADLAKKLKTRARFS